jgi:hypothetical protein
MDGSYSTLDEELQHNGWVKINPGDAGRWCGNIFGQNKSWKQYQYFSVNLPVRYLRMIPSKYHP